MSAKYSVVIVGMGKRGMHYAAAFKDSDRFEIAGICDIDEARMAAAKAEGMAALPLVGRHRNSSPNGSRNSGDRVRFSKASASFFCIGSA